MHEAMEGKTQMQESYYIRKLDDGTFVLSGNKGDDNFEYSYESVDELLSDLKDDLGGEQKQEKGEKESHDTLKKIMTKSEDKEYEDKEDEE